MEWHSVGKNHQFFKTVLILGHLSIKLYIGWVWLWVRRISSASEIYDIGTYLLMKSTTEKCGPNQYDAFFVHGLEIFQVAEYWKQFT